jgi:hypothetical protein
LCLAFFTLGMLLLPAADASAWWNAHWQKRRKLTFNNAGQSSHLANFPVLVVLDAGRVDYAKTQDAGQDLRFVDADDQTVLSHEIELWNEGGTSYVWVKVPQIDGGSTTDHIWMYYDNPSVSAPTVASQRATWDTSFMMVQHMNETCPTGPPHCPGTPGSHTDSTVNGNDSIAIQVTQQGTATGRIATADQFVLASSDFVQVADDDTLDAAATESILVEAWVRPADAAASKHVMSKEWDGATPGTGGIELSIPGSQVRFYVSDAGAECEALAPDGSITAGSYYYVVGRYDRATNECEVFLDGSVVASGNQALGTLANGQPLGIGREEDGGPAFELNGEIDEVRVSKWTGVSPRHDDWIRAQFESMRNGSAFITYGAQGQVNLRSIGSITAVIGGNVAAVSGSRMVNGSGTTWLTSNRGRGDRITINMQVYTILEVYSDTLLELTEPARETFSGGAYSIQRKFSSLFDWEECIDGGAAGLGICEGPLSSSLVADNRTEIGIAYDDFAGSDFIAGVTIQGSTTDDGHTITLTADHGNRHYGIPGAGVVIAGGGAPTIQVQDDHVTVEWLEISSGASGGILVQSLGASNDVVIRNNLVHAADTGFGINLNDDLLVADVYNNVVYSTSNAIRVTTATLNAGSRVRILNNTMYRYAGSGFDSSVSEGPTNLTLTNNIAADDDAGEPGFVLAADPNPASRSNLSANSDGTDGTALAASPGGNERVNLFTDGDVQFVDAAAFDLHISMTSQAADNGDDLSSIFGFDVDGAVRQLSWDIGADDAALATEVVLESLSAVPGNASVVLEWRTASELRNLGFHLYRSLGENGPWTRLTKSLIPGLGSSALGQAYSWRDTGLTNGTRYFYRLEDVDASSKVTSHGPVSAVPLATASSAPKPGAGDAARKKAVGSSCPAWVLQAYGSATGTDPNALSLGCTRLGDPDAASLAELRRDQRSATLELRTGGFYALHEPGGNVRVFVPGFDFPQEAEAAALPIRRVLADAVVGRQVQLGDVRALELSSFALSPSALGKAEMHVGRDGTVRALRRGRHPGAPRGARRFPMAEVAKLLPSLFQGEKKSAVVEIAPLRFDEARRRLVLARRVLVKLLFTGREAGESGRGSVGRAPWRKPRPSPVSGELLARLHTASVGLHAARFEDLFPGLTRGFALAELKLTRQGETVGFHVEPPGASFGPGGRLFFYADRTTGSTEYAGEVAYELSHATGGVQLPRAGAAPGATPVAGVSSVKRVFETNRLYQPGLLEAQDPWLWEAVAQGVTRVKSVALAGVSGSGTASIDVYVEGASESGQAVDHHVSVSVNGTLVGEASFAGRKPFRVSASFAASLLREGANDVSLTNVGDTGVTSVVFLDRIELQHPQQPALQAGRFEGTWSEDGTATLSGAGGGVALLDLGTDGASPRWLTGFAASGGRMRFRARTGRRYLATTQPLAPRVALPEPSTLKRATNQADYVLIAPRAFLAAAEPLLARREDQGLRTRAVAFEEIAAEFGHGQASAEAIRSFLGYAFHSWSRPSPRYVLLLGDASFDPRNFAGTSPSSPLPALWTKTSYLWTASDPLLAAVNGADSVPDLAIGRLPAATLEQAEALVAKLLAWEASGQGLAGAAALVADNPDLGGDFEADVEEIRASYLAGREAQVLKLSELGVELRPSIRGALDSGLSYLSYVGHGGSAVWASENVWNISDAASLQAQSRQPLLVTMNCLNGYFVAPTVESLSESLLKVEGRGAIAAFSPSGLSLDGPAHQYHRALMAELTSGRHERLGDAVTAAQATYAGTGLMPELLSVYHLLGDPATPIR